MKCPYCRTGTFHVQDSRSHSDGFPVRRRRVCDHCSRRVCTVEVLEDVPLKVVKKDGSREPFNVAKLRSGLEKACYKRPISIEQMDGVIRGVESEIYASHFGEVPATALGELVMKHLKDLDQVAYVRFASVYRAFQDVSDFMQAVEPMLAGSAKRKTK